MKTFDRMYVRWTIGVLASLFAVAVATAAVAQGEGGGAGTGAKGTKPPAKTKPTDAKAAPAPPPYGFPGGLIERNAKRLGLSDETVAAMRETIEKSRAENEKLRARVETEQANMRKLLDKDVPDEAAVMTQAEKIGDLMVEQRKNQLRAMIKMRSMLTPEQRAELDKIRGEHPLRREGGGPPGHGRHGDGPPPGAPHGRPKPPPAS
jgi:Spy/CpxP family protein refolding chaperone